MRVAATTPARRPNRQARRGPSAQIETVDAMTDGWVQSENQSDLPELGATDMVNWYPEPNSVRLRPGSDNHADLPREWTVTGDDNDEQGMWSDGTTLYVSHFSPSVGNITAHNLFTGERDESKDITLGAAQDNVRRS